MNWLKTLVITLNKMSICQLRNVISFAVWFPLGKQCVRGFHFKSFGVKVYCGSMVV